MGVQGLTTLIEANPEIYRDVKFRKRRLVIDGCNFLYLLYFDSGLDLSHGGEYAAFEDLVERFVKALKDCGISPYVVLDGGIAQTDKKDETIRLRAMDRLQKAHQAVEGTRQAVNGIKKVHQDAQESKVLPQMASLVFRQTLARLEVPVAQCYAEADQEIAALAKEWKCPVLSNDSDFFIFDLPGGLLPISHFHWEVVKRIGSQSYIPSKIYYSSSFCIVFDIEPQLLPALSSLAGNDYVKLQRLNASIRWAEFAPAVNGKSPQRLKGLLCWLKDFKQPMEAFEAALGLLRERELSEEKKAEVMEGLNLGMEEYQLPPSSLKRFFIDGVAPPFPEVEEEMAGWVLLPVMRAQLTSDVLDVLLFNTITLSCPVDRADFPSAHLTSRPIRQVMYRLLLGETLVNENDREGLQLKSFQVQPAASGVPEELELKSLNQAEPSVCLQVLLEALGVPEACLDGLQPHLRLLVAVTCFWLQRAEPKPDETLLKALLLGVSHGDSLRQQAALKREKKPLKLRLDADVLHSFNQWQGCLRQSVHLNQLLGFPLPEPQIARCYEGTLVHRLVHMLRRERKLKTLLKSEPSVMREYHKMLTIVQRFHFEEALMLTRVKRRELEPLKDLTPTLMDLFYLYEEDEVSSAVQVHKDLYLDDILSVRTRYRSKERSSRCDNLIMARKQECRRCDLQV
ncbi:protein asteroid homolog 1-like [Labrus mixtus]|uniref:protein asteroid homolog 1-like n=1 Tax=Labrus mixtus TaxID=508554 RepID=UPI0029C02BB5|nr:protein asteroid homolog 1-like [Labrus mixtus]